MTKLDIKRILIRFCYYVLIKKYYKGGMQFIRIYIIIFYNTMIY